MCVCLCFDSIMAPAARALAFALILAAAAHVDWAAAARATVPAEFNITGVVRDGALGTPRIARTARSRFECGSHRSRGFSR
jgi:hypothetical protein